MAILTFNPINIYRDERSVLDQFINQNSPASKDFSFTLTTPIVEVVNTEVLTMDVPVFQLPHPNSVAGITYNCYCLVSFRWEVEGVGVGSSSSFTQFTGTNDDTAITATETPASANLAWTAALDTDKSSWNAAGRAGHHMVSLGASAPAATADGTAQLILAVTGVHQILGA